MIYIDRKSISIPEIFNSQEIEIANKRLFDFYQASSGENSQRRFSRPFDAKLTRNVKKSLEDLFKQKCAYCESLIPVITSTGYIDNFRPKSNARGLNGDFSNDHYWWLTYEWKNMYYSCEICDRYKSSWFPVEGNRIKALSSYSDIIRKEKNLLIDPCNDRPEEHLIYNENGRVDFLTPKGKTTIDILKLNRQELVDAREFSLRELYSDWELLIKLFSREASNRKKIKTIAVNWESLFTQFSDKSYLGIKRFMLSKWMSNRPDIQEYLSRKIYEDEQRILVESTPLMKFEDFVLKELNDEEKVRIEDKLKINLLKHIYIEKLKIKNFKCFSDIEIDLKKENVDEVVSDESLRNEPWLLFLGENGVGKSSILKALVIGLCGNQYLKTLGINANEIIKHNEETGFIEIYLVGELDPIKVDFNKNEIISSIDLPIVNLVAYNSIRLSPKKGKLMPEKNKFENVKVKNLFDYSVSLIDADKWLLSKSQKNFDRVSLTLKDLMMLDPDDRIKKDKNRIVVERNGKDFFIEELSDGYQSVYSLAVDIMATFLGENTSFDLVEGIVLIDEIGTHLHPRWRMEVVQRLRNAFPKIQFLVTTHEPLCLRGLKSGETVVLSKNSKKGVVAITELPDPSELRIDQILTSDFFGLRSTIDPNTERLFDEYYSILALNENDRNDEQNKRILELSDYIPRSKHLGEDLREELVYYVIDELLAKKTREDGLKIKEDLKLEAIKRVESLWKTIDNKTGFL